MRKLVHLKKKTALFISVITIPALFFFVQNCAKSDSAQPVAIAAGTPLVIVSSTTAEINLVEGSTADFLASLNTQPDSTVTMSIAPNDISIATLSPTSLSFTPASWNTPQTITLTGVEDDDTQNDDTTITVVSAGLPTLTLIVHVTDNDTQSLYTNVNTFSLNENADSTFEVRLSAQPSASVTVSITSPDPNAVSVSPSSLIFTPANWITPQTVTVTGENDADIADENVNLSVESSALTTLNVSVDVIDDDTLTIVTDLSSVTVNEGATASLGIKLSAQPPSTTTVTLSPSDSSAATVSPSTLNFTPANWFTYQYAVVTGVSDFDTSNDSSGILLTGAGVPNKNISVTVSDDDVLAIVTDLSSVTVNEGSTANLGIKLNAQPPSTTTVTLSPSDSGTATVSPSTLNFTPANWFTYQYAVVTGVADADTSTDSTSLVLTNPSVTNKNVTITVNDTTPVCGNAIVQASEQCDDGNPVNNDGCTNSCLIESGYTCSGSPSVCQLKFARGISCSTDSNCASGFCSDGVCCEARCGGSCEKCNLAGRNGFCDAIPVSTDPDNECPADSASTCNRSGLCSGARSCALYSVGTTCVAASCSSNTSFSANTCNGVGTCVDNGSVSCGFYNCNSANGLCRTTCTTSADCAAGKTCSAGACQ